MHENELAPSQQKVLDKALSLDARDVANKSSAKNLISNDRSFLEINIVETTAQYQEVEIIYGSDRKKRRKKITKFLPENLASIIYSLEKDEKRPSSNVGATKLKNLSHGLQDDSFLLQEKFLRILAKINQVSELKTPEKIWDSNERINTTEKVILLAVYNHLKPESESLDRVIISQRSSEISDQNSFKKFISETLDLTKSSEKLSQTLFGDLDKKLSEEKRAHLFGVLRNILSETDESKRDHQVKFLQKILNEISNAKQTTQNSL